ncbi:unnamed protein product [Rotaria magnacalcarata]|uniref:Tc1-like transposase DDE domain-containing protein n=1 Tax=Rotaria magnacalcarata TaxID=392030 RepID=A0A816BWP2_9BILA|nr:unnamed protein product [Rotaria magnacalcarata]
MCPEPLVDLRNPEWFRRTYAELLNVVQNSKWFCMTNTKLAKCLAHFNWTINDWKRVIFSNETTFYVIKRKNKVKIWRTKDEQWKEGCMEVAAIGGGGRVNFWGAIASEGTDNYLIPKVHLYQMENDFFYQHDNARYHVSRQVQTKLHELGIKLSEWSAKSPDLNAIKHLWSIIDDKLKSRSISSVNELTEALSTEWLSIKPELCYELVFTMSKKIQKCIANNGKYIHY